jgi:hypothetical protein
MIWMELQPVATVAHEAAIAPVMLSAAAALT